VPAPYRQQPPETTRREVAFSALLPATRVRLAEACNGGWPLRVLASQQKFYLSGRVLWALATCQVVLLLFVLWAGQAGWSCPPRPPSFVLDKGDTWPELGLLAALMTPLLLALRALLGLHRGERRPFPPGVYLFARELVDARSEALKLYSTGAIHSIKKTGIFPRYEVSLCTGETFSFPAEIESSTEVEQRILALRERVEESESRGDLATLELHDPFFEERGCWDDLPPGEPPRGALSALARAAAASCAVVLLLALVCDLWTLNDARASKNKNTLASLSRSPMPLATLADRFWLSAAIETEDQTHLMLYSALGQHKEDAWEARERATGGRCQSRECWLGIYLICAWGRTADLPWIERSLPYRHGWIYSHSRTRYFASRPDISHNSLDNALAPCGDKIDAVAVARLDIKNATLAPLQLDLLWVHAESEMPEVRQEARAALGRLYGEAKAALQGQEQTPWARAQGALFELLSARDLDVDYTITHEVEGRPLITGLILPVEDLEEQLSAEVEQELKRRASPLLRLRYRARASELSAPSLTLRLVWSRSADLRSVELSRAAWVVGLPEQKTPLVFEGKPQTPPRWERRLGDGHFAKNQASLAGLLGQVF